MGKTLLLSGPRNQGVTLGALGAREGDATTFSHDHRSVHEICPATCGEAVVSGLRRRGLVGTTEQEHGVPELISIYNGTGFTSRVFDAWAHRRGVKLHFIAPEQPVQKAHI